MSFFNSDIVRAEMAEISELQEEVYSNVMKFHYMNDNDKSYHINLLEQLIAVNMATERNTKLTKNSLDNMSGSLV